MKYSEALQYSTEIEKATDHLNRLIQGASVAGMTVEVDYVGFRHVGGLEFDIVQTTTKVRPSDLEIDK